jgi:hypothetical protein
VIDLIVLQARAAREFGVPWEAFDTLTPFELEMIAEDYKKSWIADQKLNDARAARVAAAAFQSRGHKIKESDFMPDYSEKTEVKIESDDLIRAKLLMWASILNS